MGEDILILKKELPPFFNTPINSELKYSCGNVYTQTNICLGRIDDLAKFGFVEFVPKPKKKVSKSGWIVLFGMPHAEVFKTKEDCMAEIKRSGIEGLTPVFAQWEELE